MVLKRAGRGLTVSKHLDLWKDTWLKQKKSQIVSAGFTEADVRAGGRATKQYPNKEDEQWWFDNGLGMVNAWEQWRNNSGWKIATIGSDGKSVEPAIELAIDVEIAELSVKMVIDRVMYIPTAGTLTRENFVVLDLKSGKSAPKSDLQLALYATGIELVYGFRPRWGTYWMARDGVNSPIIDLDQYPKEMFEDIFAKFKLARDNGVFMPNLNHCVMCSVVEYCKYRTPNPKEV